jgi:rhamnulokinase
VHSVLFLPDYFNFLLSGRKNTELSIASTSQLLSAARPAFSSKALRHFGIPKKWFAPALPPRSVIGPAIHLAGFENCAVVNIPGHDTAAAFDAMPSDPESDDVYIASGTWCLVGFIHKSPLLSHEAMLAGVTNERMGDGRFRPLKNVLGLWLLERLFAEIGVRPETPGHWQELIDAADALPEPRTLLDLADPTLFNPASMKTAIDAQISRHSPSPSSAAEYMRLICESIAQGQADVITHLERLGKRSFSRIIIVGGGAKNRLLCQATACRSGKPVLAVDMEASAIGNLANQLVSIGKIDSLAEFHRLNDPHLPAAAYEPF